MSTALLLAARSSSRAISPIATANKRYFIKTLILTEYNTVKGLCHSELLSVENAKFMAKL
jgi:hypothetical protein